MRNSVTVVFVDKTIMVDDQVVVMTSPISNPEEIHAIHWRGGSGRIEFMDGTHVKIEGQELYDEDVAPYVKMFEVEYEIQNKKVLPSVKEAVEIQKKHLKWQRFALGALGVEYDGMTIDTTPNDVTKVLFLALEAQVAIMDNEPWEIEFHGQNGETRIWNAEQMLRAAAKFGTRIRELHTECKDKCAELDNCKTHANVEAVNMDPDSNIPARGEISTRPGFRLSDYD